MKRKQKQPELRPEGRDRWVVNLTERNLTPNQQEVLRMGLNFAPVPTKFPLQDTIASVEEAARQLPKDDADDLRGRVAMRNLEECPAAQRQHEEGAPEGLEGAQEPGG